MTAASLAASLVLLLPAVPSAGSTAAPGRAQAAVASLPLAGTEASSPSATSSAPGRTDVFTVSGGHLVYRYRLAGGSWSRPRSLGGDLASQPAAVSRATGSIDAFARGRDNRLWHRARSGGTWSPWESLGGTLSSAPAVTSQGPDRLDVVVRHADNALRHRSWIRGRGWSGWHGIGGVFTSSPAVTSWAPGRLDIFARSGDNTIRRKTWTSTGGWTGWQNLRGAATSQPAATSPGAGILDVVVRGTGGGMYLRHFVSGTGWTAWQPLGGPSGSGPGAMRFGAAVRLVERAADGAYKESVRSTPTGTWSPWTKIDTYEPFRRLGTWVDVFDYSTVNPATAIPAMRSRGVRVVYLQTARFNSASDFFDAAAAGRWVDLAHANGLKIVGWYLPSYSDMNTDVRRTVAITRFVSSSGQRFDAVGVDIERTDDVGLTRFNSLLVTHLSLVRAQTDYVVGAIVPSPFGTDPGNHWAGFPWAAVGSRSEVVVPMALWSFRSNAGGTPYSPDQVYLWVRDQVQRARSLSGARVSVEGGVAGEGVTPVTADRIARFVDAAIDGKAIGGSNYDYATTDAAFWPTLARLNGL